jgi:hypothetical protein
MLDRDRSCRPSQDELALDDMVVGCWSGFDLSSAVLKAQEWAAIPWAVTIAWLVEEGTQFLSGSGFRFYKPGAFSDDLLFYVGWSLGLAVAPNPLARN